MGYSPTIIFSVSILIRAHISRYEDKRWIPRDGKPTSPTREQEDKASVYWQRPGERNGHGHVSSPENTFEERKNTRPPSSSPATRISIPLPPKGPEQVFFYWSFLSTNIPVWRRLTIECDEFISGPEHIVSMSWIPPPFSLSPLHTHNQRKKANFHTVVDPC